MSLGSPTWWQGPKYEGHLLNLSQMCYQGAKSECGRQCDNQLAYHSGIILLHIYVIGEKKDTLKC